MIWTTKIKLLLKKYLPSQLFSIVRFLADKTILKILPLFFKYKISKFKKEMVKDVFYDNKKFRIIINPKNGYLDAQIYTGGLYEKHIVREIINNTKEGDVCIDVGANIGHHTIIMSQNVKDTGKVYAYEPIPKIKEQMEKSLSLNNIKNVDTIQIALSDKEEVLELNICKESIASSSLVNIMSTGEKITIQTKTLDSYNYDRVDFMKIDVEGFEYNVLLGAEKTIAKNKPTIIIEYSPIYYRTSNPSHSKEILSFFKKYNYTILDLEDNKKEITNIESFIKEFADGMRSQTNLLVIKH